MHSREITAEAFDWVVRLERGLNHDEQLLLERWLAQDTRCVGALARAQAYAVHVDAVKDFSEAQKLRLRSTTFRYSSNRMGWAAAAAAILVTISFLVLRQSSNTIEALTAMGEVRQVPLTDGSAIDLDTNSHVEISYEPAVRNVRLQNGAAIFSVAKDAKRPFLVQAGDIRVKAVGTEFLVRRTPSGEQVIVIHGAVDVWREIASPSAVVRLNAGYESTSTAHDLSQPQALGAAGIERATLWRTGYLEFDGQSLQDAATNFNRYNNQVIEVSDARLAGAAVAGRFRATDPLAFAQAASTMLSAHLRIEGNHLILEPNRP
jgi:transmembrane sensor